MNNRPIILTVLVWGLATFAAPAQHDVQRNAVQQIADGKHAKAEEVLQGKRKPNAGPAETLFVEMLNELARDRIDAARGKAEAARKAGIPIERFAAGPRELLGKLPPLDGIGAVHLVHGPMLGSVTDSAASFWVRTRTPAEVTITLGDRSVSAKTSADTDFTSVLRIEGLQASTTAVNPGRNGGGSPPPPRSSRFGMTTTSGATTAFRVRRSRNRRGNARSGTSSGKTGPTRDTEEAKSNRAVGMISRWATSTSSCWTGATTGT